MTSDNETVSAKISKVGNITKCMTSECNSGLSFANADRQPPLQRGLMNFQLYNKSLKDCSLGKRPANLNVSRGGETKLTVSLRTSH